MAASDPAALTISSARSRDLYNASVYFSPSYFYGGSAGAATVGPPQVPGRDGLYYAALVALLQTLDSFDTVILGAPTSRTAVGADSHPLAIVLPRGWEEADDTDPSLWIRRVAFTIRIVVRIENDTAPFDQLDQLATVLQARVDQADLGDQCIPALTKIRAGRYGAASQYPEWSIDLDGEFSLLIDPMIDLMFFD